MKEELSRGLLSTERPLAFFPLNNGQGTTLYNHNIEEVLVIEDENGNVVITTDSEAATGTRFKYDSLRVEYPICADNIFRTLLNARYGADMESKLRNEYDSAEIGLLPESYKQPYRAFLSDRIAMKQMVDDDCSENNIPQHN